MLEEVTVPLIVNFTDYGDNFTSVKPCLLILNPGKSHLAIRNQGVAYYYMEPSPSTLVQFLELGFAAAAALAGGFFIVLLIKYILESVVGQAKSLHGMILALDNRIKTMNNDVIRIDTLISQVVGIRPDLDRIARADGKVDARRD